MKNLAQFDPTIFGKISPPPGMNIGGGDPFQGLSNIFSSGLRIILIIAGILVLIYLFWGAFDFIASEGDSQKVAKAQQKITGAIIGLILIFFILSLWGLLLGNILGIIVNEGGSWRFKLPVLQ